MDAIALVADHQDDVVDAGRRDRLDDVFQQRFVYDG